MGGVAGHMDHLYENRELTFGKIKEILNAASSGELTAEEKVDGQNLFLSYSIPEGKAKGARNKGNLRSGGLDGAGLAQKFAGRGGLTEAFTGGFSTFEKAVEALSDQEKERIFGPNANIWYNAEVMDPGSKNVILYDDKTLKIHDVGHFVFDRETGEKQPIPEGTLETLDNAFDRMKKRLHGDDFNLARQAKIELQKLEDDTALEKAIGGIDSEMKSEGLKDNSTILDYMVRRLSNGIDTDLPKNLKDEIIFYILKLPKNIGLKALKKGLNNQDLQDLTQIIKAQKMLLKQAIEPLETIVHDFTVELLKGLKSIFIADNDKEVARLKAELAEAVKDITSVGAENPEAMAIMQQHLNKIKDFTNITTPVEAVVFDYDGHTYKFAGNYAPMNQILGMFRYGNLKRSTKESLVVDRPIITEKESNIKSDRARKFVLSLPKFAPSEAWGDPGSMERSQVEKIFATISGGASVEKRFEDLRNRIKLDNKMTSPQRMISTLIILESLTAVIENFTSSSAGFVFEGFLSAMLSGQQAKEITDKGNLPIEDMMAFSTLEGHTGVPISLKLLSDKRKQKTKDGKAGKAGVIHGSFTNLVDALNEYGEVVYIVGWKLGEEIKIEQFVITRDNIFDLLTQGTDAKVSKRVFGIDRKGTKNTYDLYRKAANWEEQYTILRNTNGYDAVRRDKLAQVAAEVDQEDPQVAEEGLKYLTVERNRKIWNRFNSLLTESKNKGDGGAQWSITVSTLGKIGGAQADYKVLATLPVNTDSIVKIAETYMDNLSTSIDNVFEATQQLSEDISNYFTYENRSKAINAGEKALRNTTVIANELTKAVNQSPGQRNESLNTDAQVITEKEGKRIALFPGKFKPPHRGHFDYVNKIAKRPDVDEVIVLISPVDYPEVSNEQSLRIWEEYLENGEPNITAKIADYRSPVQAVYEFVADPESATDGDTVLLVKSSKDVGDTRFDRAQSYAERHNPGVNVEDIVEDPVQSKEGLVYSARDLRKAIAERDKETFLAYMPPGVDGNAIWNSVIPQTERLNSLIDNTLDEMSAMSAGAVAGYAGPFGGTVKVRNKPKREKPKVRKAKRQRRR